MGKILGIFIGLVFISWGITIIFGINFPVVEVFFGGFLIAIGIRLILKK